MIRGAVAIFRRDFKKFLSNPFVVIMTLAMPIMYLVIFGNAMGGTISHIPVAVVQDGPPYNDTPLFTNAAFELNHITQKDYPKLLDITEYTDEIAAKQALGKGLVSAVIVFPAEGSSNHAIRLYVDSSDSITPALIESALNGVLASLAANNPVMINNIYGDIKYIQFFGVGVIMMAIFTSTMFGGGIALIKDRENGIHEGYLVTPVQRTSIIAGIISSGTITGIYCRLYHLLDRYPHYRHRHPEHCGFPPGDGGDPDCLYRGHQSRGLVCLTIFCPAGIRINSRIP